MTAAVAPLFTDAERQIIEVIRAFALEHGFAPNVWEIAELAGMSTAACRVQIGRLGAKEWISVHPSRPRAVVVLNPADGTES